MVITDKNKMDFANAKRFFSGLSFTDIKSSVASGCFIKASINFTENNVMILDFGSLSLTLRNANKAEIDSWAKVYDSDGNCMGTYDFESEVKVLPEGWESLVTDDMLHDLLQKRNIQTIECLQIEDIPEEMKETICQDYKEEYAEEIAKDWIDDNDGYALEYIKENVSNSVICDFVKDWLDSIC